MVVNLCHIIPNIDILKQEILTFCMAGREPILGAMWFVYALLISLCGYSIVSWIISKFIKTVLLMIGFV